jgi:hypothetical protein
VIILNRKKKVKGMKVDHGCILEFDLFEIKERMAIHIAALILCKISDLLSTSILLLLTKIELIFFFIINNVYSCDRVAWACEDVSARMISRNAIVAYWLVPSVSSTLSAKKRPSMTMY